MDVTYMRRDDTPTSVYNPLDYDIEVPYRDDTNMEHVITHPALEVETYPAWQAKHVKKNIINHIIAKREIRVITAQKMQELEDEVDGKH